MQQDLSIHKGVNHVWWVSGKFIQNELLLAWVKTATVMNLRNPTCICWRLLVGSLYVTYKFFYVGRCLGMNYYLTSVSF